MMAEPREVEERTETTPGMLFMASSMGRVMVAIISLAGMMPLFTITTMRGKSVRGKTDDGVFLAQKIPATHSRMAMNVMERAWRVVNWPSREDLSGFIGPQTNWLPKRRQTN